jgi:hypothetical protein
MFFFIYLGIIFNGGTIIFGIKTIFLLVTQSPEEERVELGKQILQLVLGYDSRYEIYQCKHLFFEQVLHSKVKDLDVPIESSK